MDDSVPLTFTCYICNFYSKWLGNVPSCAYVHPFVDLSCNICSLRMHARKRLLFTPVPMVIPWIIWSKLTDHVLLENRPRLMLVMYPHLHHLLEIRQFSMRVALRHHG